MSKETRGFIQPVDYHDRHSLIQSRLKQFIVENRLQPGDKLPPEEAMAEQLGVSRPMLREALRSMEALGIIAVQPGVGRVVLPFSFQPLLANLSYGFVFHDLNIFHIIEIRQGLDAFFIESAIHNVSAQDLEILCDLVKEMELRTAAGQSVDAADYAFHRLLYERSGNPLALQLFEITWQVRLAAMDTATATYEIPTATAADHQELLQAVSQKDVAAARAVIIDHHRHVVRRFRQEVALERAAADHRQANAEKGGDQRHRE